MPRHRGLALAAYLVGATLVIIPLFDTSLSLFPAQLGSHRWRFGAAGFVANASLIPNAGLLLLLITAITYGHNAARRALGIVAFVGVAFFVAAIGLFALDALQTRPEVNPQMNTPFALAAFQALAKMIIAAAVLFVLGLVGVRKATSPAAATQSPPRLVGDPGAVRGST